MPKTPADIVKRFIDEIFVAGRPEAVDELVTPDFTSHGLPGSGPEVMKAAIGRVSQALTDSTMEIQDTVMEGDRVAVRLVASALQSGPFMGMPPSGKRYTIEEIHIFRIADGRVAEHWHQFDGLGMLRQLGVLPQPSGTSQPTA
jgi:predicted SnoaL-like aldol condensation-catalyzing enzyme